MPDLSILSPRQLADLADRAAKLKHHTKGGSSGRPRGRPRVHTVPMTDASVYVAARDWMLMGALAKEEGTNRNELLRRLMRNYLVEQGYREP